MESNCDLQANETARRFSRARDSATRRALVCRAKRPAPSTKNSFPTTAAIFGTICAEPLDGLQTTREPLAMRSGAGRKIGSCIFKDGT